VEFALKVWRDEKMRMYRKNKMSSGQIDLLESTSGWKWIKDSDDKDDEEDTEQGLHDLMDCVVQKAAQ
jgi:hypothetical protein